MPTPASTGMTPIYRIEKDGIDITGNFNDRATSITVRLDSGGDSDTCRIVVDDRDRALARPQTGASLTVSLGYVELGVAMMGIFEINDVTYEGPPRQVTITGTSVGFRSAVKGPAIKEFDGKTLGEIVGEIARTAGVPAVVDPELAARKVPYKNMISSPLHLLQDLERQYGAIAKFEFGRLVFGKRDATQTMSGDFLPIVVLRPEDFGTWSIRHNDRALHSSVKASYRDKDTHDIRWLDILNPHAEVQDLPFRIGRIFNSKDEAEAAAQSMLGTLNRATGEGTLVLAKGDPWLRDQQQVLVSGMGDGVDGHFTVSTAEHSYTKENGLTTRLHVRPRSDGGQADELARRFLNPSVGERRGQFIVGPGWRAAGPV